MTTSLEYTVSPGAPIMFYFSKAEARHFDALLSLYLGEETPRRPQMGTVPVNVEFTVTQVGELVGGLTELLDAGRVKARQRPMAERLRDGFASALAAQRQVEATWKTWKKPKRR